MIKTTVPTTAPTHARSFCGKNNHQVEGILIAGPGVSICQDCVFLCIDIVFKNSAGRNEKSGGNNG